MKVFRVLDFVIFAAVLCIAVFLILKNQTAGSEKICVEADGRIYEYSLGQDGTFSVDGALGKTVLEIKNGKVHIIESACRNKTCVHLGWTLPLVCLPNKVVVQAKNQGDYDAVSQ